MIGKLQTDQDKQRLLDGLESAMSGGLDRSEYDRLISTLGKRVFLLHNVHAKAPMLFQTRWAMNYLTGPLTRTQIPGLNKLAGEALQAGAPISATKESIPGSQTSPSYAPQPSAAATVASAPTAMQEDEFTSTRPAIPAGIGEYFLPNNLTFTQAFKTARRDYPSEAYSQGLVYRAVILAQASARLYNLKYKLDIDVYKTALVADPDRRGVVRWDNYLTERIDPAGLDKSTDPQANFAPLEAPLNDVKLMNSLEKDFLEWAYHTTQATVLANENLKIYAGPETSEADFRSQCTKAANESCEAEIRKTSARFDSKLRTLQDRLEREQRELEQDRDELSGRKMEELGSGLETVAGLLGFGRKRSISSSLTKRRMTKKAKGDVDESVAAIKDYKEQIKALEDEKDAAIQAVNDKWAEAASQITEIPVSPLKICNHRGGVGTRKSKSYSAVPMKLPRPSPASLSSTSNVTGLMTKSSTSFRWD